MTYSVATWGDSFVDFLFKKSNWHMDLSKTCWDRQRGGRRGKIKRNQIHQNLDGKLKAGKPWNRTQIHYI